MSRILLLVAVIAVTGISSSPINVVHIMDRLNRGIVPPTNVKLDAASVRGMRFTVDRDHFDRADNTTWQMQYFESDVYFKAGGPIFIFVGGESAANPIWLQTGHMVDMAREYGAYMFHTEHRYYGTSYPVPDATVANLKWLTVDQALADLVSFVAYVKEQNPNLRNSKVLLVGGSYAGNMVAWARAKYPRVFDGAWASSAPVLAKVDFYEYKEKMNNAYLNIGGVSCHRAIEKLFSDMEELVAARNVSDLEKELNLCFPLELDNELDVWNFFSSWTNILAGPVQYQSVRGEIQAACSYIESNPDPIKGFASYLRAMYGGACISTNYDNFVAYYGQTSLDFGSQYRQWMWQTCNEFGYYQSSSSEKQVFGSSFPYDLNIAQCGDVYSKMFNNQTIFENVEDTNDKYGGLFPRASKVIYVNGDIDPWSALSIEEAGGEEMYADWVPNSSHCGDIYSNGPNDSPEMRAVRAKITRLFGEWISS